MKCAQRTTTILQSEFLIKWTWIAAVIETDVGTLPSDATMARYIKHCPTLAECITHSAGVSVDIMMEDSTYPYLALFGYQIQTRTALNIYRQMLKRLAVSGIGASDQDKVIDFLTRATIPTIANKTLMNKLSQLAPQLDGPPKGWWAGMTGSFSGGANVGIRRRNACDLLKLQSALDLSSVCPSRVQLVEKDWKGKRVITVGGAFKSFYQHGIDAELRRDIEKHSFITFQSTLRNRIRCNDFYDTIDLSNASDSVTWEHVRAFLGPWYDTLSRFRVEKLEYEGDVYCSQIVGGMGDEVTFAVETWVFYSIIISSARLAYQLGFITRDARNRIQIDSAVYGDDIVVPSGFGQAVMLNLNQLGFTPNVEKSYVAHTGHGVRYRYRETCGVEFCPDSRGPYRKYMAYSVIRFPRGATGEWFNSVDLESLVSFVNQLIVAGLIETNWGLLDRLRHLRPELRCLGQEYYSAMEYDQSRKLSNLGCFIPATQTPPDPLFLWSLDYPSSASMLTTRTAIAPLVLYQGRLAAHNMDIDRIRSCDKQAEDQLFINGDDWDGFLRTYALSRIGSEGCLILTRQTMKVSCKNEKRCRNYQCLYHRNSSSTFAKQVRRHLAHV